MIGSNGSIASEATIRPRTTTNGRFRFATLRVMRCRAAEIMIDLFLRFDGNIGGRSLQSSFRVIVKLWCEWGYAVLRVDSKALTRGFEAIGGIAADSDRGQNLRTWRSASLASGLRSLWTQFMSSRAIKSVVEERKGSHSSDRSFASRSFGWLITGIWSVFRMLLISWGALAIYYSNLPWPGLRLALAGTFAAFAIWACWVTARQGISARVFSEGFSASFSGGSLFLPQTIGAGGRRSQCCRGRLSTATAYA